MDVYLVITHHMLVMGADEQPRKCLRSLLVAGRRAIGRV